MGGKSKSSTSTQNQQETNNIVNDGEFAGSGSVVNDSNNTETKTEIDDSFNTDNSSEIEDAFNTDNSSEIDDSFNTDKSIENDGEFSGSSNFSVDRSDHSVSVENDGEFAGNSGVINILDGGAIDRAFDSTDKTIEVLGEQSTDFRESLAEQAKEFATQLGNNAAINSNSNTAVLQSLEKSTVENNKVIAELAKSTALDGQDVVAKSVTTIAKYLVSAITIIGVGIAVVVAKKGKQHA